MSTVVRWWMLEEWKGWRFIFSRRETNKSNWRPEWAKRVIEFEWKCKEIYAPAHDAGCKLWICHFSSTFSHVWSDRFLGNFEFLRCVIYTGCIELHPREVKMENLSTRSWNFQSWWNGEQIKSNLKFRKFIDSHWQSRSFMMISLSK